jgi:hypothetical protein
MPTAILGGSPQQFPQQFQIEDWYIDFGKANTNAVPASLQSGGVTSLVNLSGPDGRILAMGAAASNGVNVNAIVDDGNGRTAVSLGGGLAGSVNGGAFGYNGNGINPQLIAPASAGPVSLNPTELQSWLIDWWVKFGPVGVFPQRGDCGVTFEIGAGTIPDLNCIHNLNTGGGNGTGGAIGFGVLQFADGLLHFFSNVLGTASVPGVNQVLIAAPADIVRISFLFQTATLTQNASLQVYINKVLQGTFQWSLGAGRQLPLYTDHAATFTSFCPQVIAGPAPQDAQAFSQSGILMYNYRYRKGNTAQVLNSFASS